MNNMDKNSLKDSLFHLSIFAEELEKENNLLKKQLNVLENQYINSLNKIENLQFQLNTKKNDNRKIKIRSNP